MIKLLLGDCLKELKELKDNSIDSIVTDPPYGIGFMNKEWDNFKSLLINKEIKNYNKKLSISIKYQKWCFLWAKEIYRVLKPGGYMLCFNSSRMYHRMACAIEDAGFEIRDMIEWVYGTGFPKSYNVGEAINKKLGHNRETKWNGWGTALKPAHEPIVMARKPLSEKTVANNVLTFGTSGINIDESRIKEKVSNCCKAKINYGLGRIGGIIRCEKCKYICSEINNLNNRFPTNIIHDGSNDIIKVFGDKSRFFYCAKTSKADRNEGLEKFYKNKTNDGRNKEIDNAFQRGSTLRKNIHPTVKPTKLMQYLVKLVTPKAGIVLDPFMGSGSTGKACILEGFSFIGIEKKEEYMNIAKARIKYSIDKNIKKDDSL